MQLTDEPILGTAKILSVGGEMLEYENEYHGGFGGLPFWREEFWYPDAEGPGAQVWDRDKP
jgi:hypothetical protein